MNTTFDSVGQISTVSDTYSVTTSASVAGSTSASALKSKSASVFAKYLTQVTDFIHAVDTEGIVQFSLPSLSTLLGYSVAVIMGKSVLDIVHPDDRLLFKSAFTTCLETGQEFIIYIRYISKVQKDVMAQVKGRPFHSDTPPNSPNEGVIRQFDSVLLAAREYTGSAVDSFVELKIEAMQLEAKLKSCLLAQGMDPSNHKLLNPTGTDALITHIPIELPAEQGNNFSSNQQAFKQNNHPQAFNQTSPPGLQHDDFTESFLYSMEDQSQATAMSKYSNSFFNFGMNNGLDGFMAPASDLPFMNMSQGPYKSNTNTSTIEKSRPLLDPAPNSKSETGKNSKKGKKRRVVAVDPFCLQCGTTKSPEWRAGPEGPKTLCNACGLAWYKKKKKQSANASSNANT